MPSRRGNQLLIQRAALARQLQRKFAPVALVLDALDQLLLQQMRHSPADGRFVRPRAVRDVLRGAGIVAESERGQHPPFRNIEAVAFPIFAGELRAHFRREPVQPERHEFEEIELGQGDCPVRAVSRRGDMVAVATIIAMVYLICQSFH